MTLPANPELVKALRAIGQGLLDLADAVVAPTTSEPAPRPAKRSQKPASPAEDEQPDDDEAQTEEVEEEVKMADLQVLGKDLIKKDRAAFRKILETHDLETVSSAPVDKWKALKKDLQEALA
jgi:hypothetical protein